MVLKPQVRQRCHGGSNRSLCRYFEKFILIVTAYFKTNEPRTSRRQKAQTLFATLYVKTPAPSPTHARTTSVAPSDWLITKECSSLQNALTTSMPLISTRTPLFPPPYTPPHHHPPKTPTSILAVVILATHVSCDRLRRGCRLVVN